MNLSYNIILTVSENTNVVLGIVASVVTILGFLIPYLVRVLKRNKEINQFNPNLDVLDNYDDVWGKVKQVIDEELNNGSDVVVKNIGLDLEKILPDIGEYVRKKVLVNKDLKFEYKGLIINPDSTLIAPLIDDGSNIQKEFVLASMKKLGIFQKEFKNNPGVKLDVSSYDFLPAFHGISVNRKHLFLGFTEIKNGKIFGSDRPYIYMKFVKKISATQHYFTFFTNWFDFHWAHKNEQ